MIINGPRHWNWLMWTLITDYPHVIQRYKTHLTEDGFVFIRKIFNNNAEMILIKRTSEKCYKLAMYKANETVFKSCRTAKDVCKLLEERLFDNSFKNQD